MVRLFVVCAVVFGLSIAKASAADVTIRFATITPKTYWIYAEVLVPWKERVETESNGRIAIDLQPIGVFGRPETNLQLVESNVIEAAWMTLGHNKGRFPRAGVIELPFLLGSATEATRVFWNLHEQGYLGTEFDGVVPLALFATEPLILMTREANIREIDDLGGLRVRVPSRVVGSTLESLGAVPVGMPLTELTQSLRLGVIDGVVFPYDAVRAFGAEEILNQYVELPLSTVTGAFIINADALAAMPQDLQAVLLRNSGLDLSLEVAKGYRRKDLEGRAFFTAQPQYTVTSFGEATLSEAARRSAPVTRDWLEDLAERAIDGQALLEEVTRLKGQGADGRD